MPTTRRARNTASAAAAEPSRAQYEPRRPEGLDDVDLAIVSLLSEDARLSQRALARRIGMSPAAVSERIARLEDTGVVEGYRAKLSYSALDRAMTVFVGIQSVQGENQRRLADELLALPVVESVDVVMGPMDLMVRLRVRDQAHLRDVFFDDILSLSGVHRTESFISLESMEAENFGRQVVDSMRHSPPGDVR